MPLMHGVIIAIGRVLWLATAAGALAGAVQVLLVNVGTSSAPQQGAGAAMGAAYAVIPYVFARAWDAMFAPIASDRDASPSA